MGQSHSKRYKSKRRYQFDEGPVSFAAETGNQRRFSRKPQNVSQHLAQHSHQIAQNNHYAAQKDQRMQYKRRSSEDYVHAQMQNEAAEGRPRALSWHESRFQPLASAVPDVRSRMTGNYRPNITHSSRRETSYFASHEDDNVTSMGYYSMDRRETYVSERDSSFAPPSIRPDRSEVTEFEIQELVEELHDSDWMRLGSHLGISSSRLAAFRDRYNGNVSLCAMEVLLLWKHNCSEVINPRSHLALALSTVGREDLYGKIKRRTYLIERDSKPSQNDTQRDNQNTMFILDDDSKVTTINTERSFDRTESGVETIESLSDSLEDESDIDEEDDHNNDRGWNGHDVIHVPITISQDDQSRPSLPKPKSITVPIVTTRPPEPVHPIPSATGEDVVSGDSIEIACEDPLTVTTTLELVEPAETVSVAIIRSIDDTIDPSDVSTAATEELPPDPRTNSRDTNELGDFGHKDDSDSVVAKRIDLPKPLNNLATRHDASQTNTELSEDELRLLSSGFRTSSEWCMLGKRLGLSQSEIKNLSKTNDEGVTKCAFGVLKLWKRRFGNPAKERHILASVTSDLGRDDLYSAIKNNKLTHRLKVLETSLGRWQDVFKERYTNSDFGDMRNYIDMHVVHRNEYGTNTNLSCRHDIFKARMNDKHSSLMIIHGDAGCGKTTLLKRLAQDWAEGNNQSPLSKVPLVLFLNLQELIGCRSIGHAAVKYLLSKDACTTPEMIDDYLQMYPEKSLLLVDGFDTSRSKRDMTAILELRDRMGCRVVVSSRACLPESDDYPCKFSSVEMQAISLDQRSKFVNSYFESDAARSKELLQYLLNDEVLSSFSSRPMFLATICHLWKNMAQLQDINTLSDMVTSSLVLRFIGHEDVNDVVEGVSKVMSALSRLALETLIQPVLQLSFKTKDLSDDNERECAELAERVGLIQCTTPTDEDSTTAKEEREWSFINPLVHEKCAAIKLASLVRSDPERFEDIIVAIGSIEECMSMKYVLMFASGESLKAAQRILKLLSDLAWKKPGSRAMAQELALKCNFECHRNDGLNRELQFSMRSLHISAFSNSFMADISFRYFILNSVREAENPVKLQKVQFLLESRAHIEYATACLQNSYFTSIPEFIFEMPKTFSPSREASRRLSDDVITPYLRCLMVSSILSSRDFISNLHASENLEELHGSDIDPKYIAIPAWCRNYPNLKTLSLSCVMYQDSRKLDDHRTNLKGLETVLCTLMQLECIQLSNFFCSEIMVQILTKVLQTLPKLSQIQIGPSGDQLHHYSEEVEETCGEVTEGTIHSFIKATKKSTSLRILQLSCYGSFEKLYQLMRSETTSKGSRRGNELQYTPPGDENGYWVFKR